jgi:hypothetical protein
VIKELDSVVLSVDLPNHRLCAGDIGTVVLAHGSRGYEVEFATLDGVTLAVVTLEAAQARPFGKGEIAHVRRVAA